MTARREWLEQVALGAAVVALPPWFRRRTRTGVRLHLDLALECARWIEASRQTTTAGAAWPADPLKPASVGLDLYNGMPGVVLFYSELYRVTKDPAWLAAARAGADHLHAAVQAGGDEIDPGLYTGLAGIAFTLMAVADAGGGDPYDRIARQTAGRIAARVTGQGPVDWDGSFEIINGAAGIGLLLLEAHRRWADPAPLAVARRTGRGLMDAGQAAPTGRMWYPGREVRRNYPNFSHGTAGVAYFLATLHQRTGERAFLDGALDGARYLESIATRVGDGALIFHHGDGGEDLYYLSWCHGPAGTSRLYERLHRITGDPSWIGRIGSLARGLLGTGIPEQRTPGFWNNISQCCGNVGVGELMIDLAESGSESFQHRLLERIVKDTLARSSRDAAGARWVQAENRVDPEGLVAQTGYMQGAAGVGAFVLRLDGFERGIRRGYRFPDTPFGESA